MITTILLLCVLVCVIVILLANMSYIKQIDKKLKEFDNLIDEYKQKNRVLRDYLKTHDIR